MSFGTIERGESLQKKIWGTELIDSGKKKRGDEPPFKRDKLPTAEGTGVGPGSTGRGYSFGRVEGESMEKKMSTSG